MMKKLLSLLFAAVLLVGLLPAMPAMAADEISAAQTEEEVTYTTEAPEQPVLTLTNLSAYDVAVTVEVYDEVARGNVQTLHFTLLAGDAPLVVNGYVYKNLTHNGQVNTYRYRITTPGGFKATLYFAQTMHVHPETKAIYYTQVHNGYYPRNTVSSFGPQFRVIDPKLTKQWYMFTPIDLSQQGRQVFTLVASNMYEVGEVYVDVYGDMVSVTYRYFYDGETDKVKRVDDFLHFFPDFNAVTDVDPANIKSPFAFGQPFSISGQLGGDTNVLMFVRNRLSYYRFPMPTVQFARNYPKSEPRMAERGYMLGMMDPVPGLDLVNEHNYAN